MIKAQIKEELQNPNSIMQLIKEEMLTLHRGQVEQSNITIEGIEE
jgi:hypothetical protein